MNSCLETARRLLTNNKEPKHGSKMIDTLNMWNEHAKTDVETDIDSVKREIDNLKQRGIFIVVISMLRAII